jgi:hypothetical protein
VQRCKINIDYKTASHDCEADSDQHNAVQNNKKNGGQNKQIIMLTIKCFKSFCLHLLTFQMPTLAVGIFECY